MFEKSIHTRIKIVMLLMFTGFIVIMAKIFYIQVFSYSKLNSYAQNLWSRNLPIEANRGVIYDTNKVVLADNITTTSLVLIPNQIKDKETTAEALSQIIDLTYEEMLDEVKKSESINRVHPEGRRLSYEIADKINDLNLEGVYLLKESQRYYPYGETLAHTIGFVGIDNQGLSGLELMYDQYLTGSYGSIKYYSDAKGNQLSLSEIYQQPQNGIDLNLTINFQIQSALESELNNAVSMYNPDQAIGIVMNPNTGEILAISSRPTFEPNQYQNYEIETINRNLPIWMTYEPGSTFKIITLAAALEEQVVDLHNDTFFDSGSVTVMGSTLHCWKHGGHGLQTFLQVVENSCNPGFVELGMRLGKESLFEYIDKFGFGEKTGIDLNGEASGILFNLDQVTDLELATTAFGQGVSVTPIQQITAVSAAINGGNLYTPYIVKSLTEPETNGIVYKTDPTIQRKVISENTSEQVRLALESVVANGSGKNAYIADYRVGGKTGTAQKVENGVYLVNNYITSFIGFLPADDPQVIVYIAIDNAKGVTQYGGTVAAPIAKNVLEASIEALNISPSIGLDKEYVYPDSKLIRVPDVTNLTVAESTKLLTDFKIEFSGSGTTVIYQTPEANTMVEEGSTIKLLLN